MLRISANLGFLWTGLPLPDAIRRAAAAGFDAVECHWPYEEDPAAVRDALAQTGIPMLGINARRGSREGDLGLSALPDRRDEALALIDEAFAYAVSIGASAVHVMAGRIGQGGADAFAASLAHACDRAAAAKIMVLIEPLNPRDAPGYHLASLEAAAEVLARVDRPELKIMFDCYHMQICGGDLLRRFEAHRERIGHIQFAAVPSRAEPDHGEVDFAWLLPALAGAGYTGYLGAEYRPRGAVEDGLGWLAEIRRTEAVTADEEEDRA